MPLYDYKCPSCKSIKENVIHKPLDNPEILCDKCNTKMTIIIDAKNFILKGIGWAKDGYTKHSVSKIIDYKRGKRPRRR